MKNGFKVIDCDLHVLEPLEVWDHIAEPYRSLTKVTPGHGGYASAPGRVTELAGYRSVAGPGYLQRQSAGRLEDEPLLRKAFQEPSPATWIEALDIEGIDIALLTPTTAAMSNLAEDPEHAAAICRAYNDWVHGFASADPQRFAFWAWVPRQAPRQAAEEAWRCVKELGAVGVAMVAAPLDGRPLSEPFFDPLWRTVNDLGVPLGLHVGAGRAGREEMHRPREGREIPISNRTLHDSMSCVAELIFGGALDRFPRLSPLIMELGASWLLWYSWRLDTHWEEYAAYLDYEPLMKPSDYLRTRFHISIDPGEGPVKHLVEDGFEDNLLISTDYPHHDSPFPNAISSFLSQPGIPDAAKLKILWTNSAKLFGFLDR